MASTRGYFRIDTQDRTVSSDISQTVEHIISPRLVNFCELVTGHSWGISVKISIPSEADSIMSNIMASLRRIKYTKMAKVKVVFRQTDLSFTQPHNDDSDDSR